MKLNLSFLLIFITLTTFGQEITTPESWEEQSKVNKALLPKYGHQEKTAAEKKADVNFVKFIMTNKELSIKNRRDASDEFIRLGFHFLQQNDFKTSMFRFNQAYLLDSTNTDIYWGYGGYFFKLGYYKKAKEHYEAGLAIDPANTHLLNDLGGYYKQQYDDLSAVDKKEALQHLETAIGYVMKAYTIDPNNEKTLYLLSAYHLLKGDCDNALRYYKACKARGEEWITTVFTKALKSKCKKVK